MFSCTSCLRRALSALVTDAPLRSAASTNPIFHTSTFARSSHYRPGKSPSRSAPSTLQKRHAATLRSLSKTHHRTAAIEALSSRYRLQKLQGNKRRDPSAKDPFRDVYAREHNNRDPRALTTQGREKLDLQLQREAAYLVDPLKLADAVTKRLTDDDFDRAYKLVLASDRHALEQGQPQGSMRNQVSWNHMIDWCMMKKDAKKGVQLWNDMKKRGHAPDSYTYTIMLRGLAGLVGSTGSTRDTDMVKTACDVYNSLFRPGSLTKVKTIHSNAAINVCAQGGDMDALWSIAARMPKNGPGSADQWTYTTILNAMQFDLLKRVSKASHDAKKGSMSLDGIFDEVISEAKQLWREIVMRWRNADLMIDQKLVAAMGRLLLMGKDGQNARDVFALVKQTMNVSVEHQSLEQSKRELAGDMIEADQQEPPLTGEDADQEDVEDYGTSAPAMAPAALELFSFAPLAKDAPGSVYASPTGNTLSLLLQASTVLRQVHIGKTYWDILTSPSGQYKLVPDAVNLSDYLRLLRLSRASRTALDLLRSPWANNAELFIRKRGTYVMAMSTCVRDKKNPNVFATADAMMDVMKQYAEEAAIAREDEEIDAAQEGFKPSVRPYEQLDMSPKVMTMYLSLAMYTTKGINSRMPLKQQPNGDLDYERDPSKNNTMLALRRLGPDMVRVRHMMRLMEEKVSHDERMAGAPAAVRRKQNLRTETGERAEEMLGLLNTMVSAYDRILAINFALEERGLGPLDAETLDGVRWQKAKITRFVTAMSQRMGYLYGTTTRGLDLNDPAVEAADEAREERRQQRLHTSLWVQQKVRRQNARDSGTSRDSRYSPETRESRRQKREKEAERRKDVLREEMMRSGLAERAVRELREKKTTGRKGVGMVDREIEEQQRGLWGDGKDVKKMNEEFVRL